MQQIRNWNAKDHDKDGFSSFLNSIIFCPGDFIFYFYLAVLEKSIVFINTLFFLPLRRGINTETLYDDR
jgi:hypothetical protein